MTEDVTFVKDKENIPWAQSSPNALSSTGHQVAAVAACTLLKPRRVSSAPPRASSRSHSVTATVPPPRHQHHHHHHHQQYHQQQEQEQEQEQQQQQQPSAHVTKVRERCRSASTTSTPKSIRPPVPTRKKSTRATIHGGTISSRARETGHAVLRRPNTTSSSSSSAIRARARSKSVSNTSSATTTVVANPKPMLQMDTLNCPNYTSTEYWDNWAANWNGEIISSIDEDINGVVTAALSAHCPSGPESFSVDFGCGVGLYLPSLAATSANVLGLDISRKLLARARADCDKRGLANVRLKRADLGTCDVRKMNIENIAHFAVCANVLISPEPCTRRSIVANLSACLKPNGVALFVVPAARSARLIEKAHGVWLAERRRRRIKACKEDERPETTSAADAKKGIFRRDDVRTKHFREAEIKKLLLKYGLETVEVSRVEYSWYTEFSDPIDILEECFDEVPFDWLIVTRKVPKDIA